MTPSPIDLPVLFQSMPIASRISSADIVAPEVQRDIFAPLLQKELQKETREKISTVQETEPTNKVDRDGSNKDGPQQDAAGHDGSRRQEQEEQETAASNASPWAGNIINVKI